MKPYKVIRLRQGSPEWLAYRRTRIGASDAPAIAGESSYGSPYSVWREKIEGPAEIDAGTALRFRLGHEMEPVALRLYAERTSRKVRPGRVLQSREIPWLFASLDAEVPPGLEDEGRIVEVKWTTSARFDDGLPGDVLVQVTHQMAVSGIPDADVVVLSPHALRIFPVRFDPDLWGSVLALEASFYHDHLASRIPPAVDGSGATTDALREQFPADSGESMIADADTGVLVRRLLDAKARALILDGEIGGMENALRFIMGDASLLSGDDFTVSYKKAKDSVKVDWPAVVRRLVDLYPGILPDYDVAIDAATSVQSGSRRLLVKGVQG